MMMLHNPAFKASDIVVQVQDEIGKVQKDGVEPKDLDRAKTFFRSATLSRLQGSMQRARLLGQYELLDGNPDFVNTEMAAFLAVTSADVQAAARKYCVADRRFVLEIVPAPPAEKPEK
jgi:zinc protease